ncbi:MAG: DUF433 domain-containing protein [Acidobacteriota bacterium]
MSVSYPHLVVESDGSARLERIPRVRVAQLVMDQMAHGWSVDEICRQYPHLQPAEVHAAMLYYWDHRDAVDREIREEWRLSDDASKQAMLPPAIARRLREIA